MKSFLKQWGDWLQLSAAILIFGLLALGGGAPRRAEGRIGTPVRLAYFPNLSHSAALLGIQTGEFEKAISGAGGVLKPIGFNAGPEAMEALLANEVDLAYVGPSPAINTFLKSEGRALRVISGACQGGAALIAAANSGIGSVADLAHHRVAIPQLGGTQDISLRYFLEKEGLAPHERGGSVTVLPIKNPDILSLMKRGQIDAAWVPEPWGARLIAEAGGKLVVDERDLWPDRAYATAVVVVRTRFLEDQAPLVDRFLAAHKATIQRISDSPEDSRYRINEELERLTGKPLPSEVLADAWSRMSFSAVVEHEQLEAIARAAAQVGYLEGEPNLNGLVDRRAGAGPRRDPVAGRAL